MLVSNNEKPNASLTEPIVTDILQGNDDNAVCETRN